MNKDSYGLIGVALVISNMAKAKAAKSKTMQGTFMAILVVLLCTLRRNCSVIPTYELFIASLSLG